MKGRVVEVTLIILVAIMLSGYFIIRDNILNDQAFLAKIDRTVGYIEQSRWEEAVISSHDVEREWLRVKYIIMVNDAEPHISLIEEYLDLFVKGTENRDEKNALPSAAFLKENYKNVIKFVPQP